MTWQFSFFLRIIVLESELLEEPLVLAGLVALLKLRSHLESGLLLLHGIFKSFLVKVGLVKANVHSVPGGHHVVIVDNLQEGLDFAAELDLSFGHALGHLAWVTVDAGDQSVAERLLR